MKQQTISEPLSLVQQKQLNQQQKHKNKQNNQHQTFNDTSQFEDGMIMKQSTQGISNFNPLLYSQTEQEEINNTNSISYNQHIISNTLSINNNNKNSQKQINQNEFFHQNTQGLIQNCNQDIHQYQHQPQIQSQFNQGFGSSQSDHQQQLYQQINKQNTGRINNSISNQQIQSQWPFFQNQNQINQQTKQYNQNSMYYNPTYFQQLSSNYNEQLQKQQSQEETGQPSQVLLVMVFELKDLQITNDQIQKIFSPYGIVNKVLIFQKNPDSTKAFVEMDSVESAKKAKEALNKQKILLTSHQKYKFKVHYSQTPELNLCNYKTEGKDYRLSYTQSSNDLKDSPLNTTNSISDIIYDVYGNQNQKLTQQASNNLSNYQSNYQNSNHGITNYVKQVRNNQLPSSQKSIPSPRNTIVQNNKVNNKFDYSQNQKLIRNQQLDSQKTQNTIGQTFGVITYIEKVEQNIQSKEDCHQSYNNVIAPPKQFSKIIQNLDLQNQDTLQQDQLDFQNIMKSFTSTSTPNSQGNNCNQNNQRTFFQSENNSNDNEDDACISQKIFQPFQFHNSNENQLFKDNSLYFEEECIKPRLDSFSIRNQTSTCMEDKDIFRGLIYGQSSQNQCQISQQQNKVQCSENFIQSQEQGKNTNLNTLEYNQNSIGIKNINNLSNLNKQQLEISPRNRKDSLVFHNSEVVYQKLHQQQNNYQTPNTNTELIQRIQSKESDILNHQTPSQTQINSKSTCSTSSTSPFHTSLFGSTPPTITNQQKMQSKQNQNKVEFLQLAPSDISDSTFLINSNTHLYSHGQNKYFQLLTQQKQNTPNTFQSPLLHESINDLISSTNLRSNNNLQEDINNSQLMVLNLGSKQDSIGNLPLQNIQQYIQQQQNEESPVIYIKNIRINELQPENIYNIFRNFGYVHTILFIKDTKTVLLQYEETNQAKMAITQLNNVQFTGDEQLRITFCKRNCITIPNIQNQKINSQQPEEQVISKNNYQSNNNCLSQNNIKGSDYFINKNNDPRSRIIQNQNKKNQFYNPASKTVFITNISLQLVQQEQDFLNIFKPYGRVTNKKITIQGKKVTALIEFDSLQTALKAICYLHNSSHFGKQIQIFFTRTIIGQ